MKEDKEGKKEGNKEAKKEGRIGLKEIRKKGK